MATEAQPVVAQVSNGVLSLDVIGSVFDFTYREIRKTLAEAQNIQRIRTTIHSPGGSAFAGFAIFAELQSHAAPVEVRITGLAASIASVIAMAAEPGAIKIHNLGRIMIHEARAGTFGTARDHEESRELLRSLDQGIASAYAEHSSWSEARILAAMAKTTWMTAQEAKKAGFVDEIIKGPDATNRLDLSPLDEFGVPEEVRQLYGLAPRNRYQTLAEEVCRHLASEPAAIPAADPELIAAVQAALQGVAHA